MNERRLPGMTIAAFAIAAAIAVQANAASGAVTLGNAEIVGKARFTLLTDRMVRCEWSESGEFEDRPSITFINRAMPAVKHTLTRKGDGAVIETDRMRLEWTGGAFNESNLVVSVANVEMLPMANANVANEKDKPNWELGIGIGNIGNNGNIKNDMTSVAVLSEDKENLLGTMRTIDGRTSIKDLLPRMEKGILSRRGVTVVDDTKTPLFVKGGDYWKTWVEERPLGGTRSVAANGRAACPQAAVRRVEDNAPYQRRVGDNAPYQLRVEDNVPHQRRVEDNAPYQRRVEDNAPYQRRVGDNAPYQLRVGDNAPYQLAAELSGLKGEHTRIAALTEDFRAAIAVAKTKAERATAEKIPGATIVDSYDKVLELLMDLIPQTK